MIKLHPLVNDYLFKYYAILRNIFADIIGQLEINSISIGVINHQKQLILLSSKPSIEQNLIEKNLLQYDNSFSANFIYQDTPNIWTNLYDINHQILLKQYKQINPNIVNGIAIPANFQNYRVIFSFGFQLKNIISANQTSANIHKLLIIGKYCLQEIMHRITLPKEYLFYKSCQSKSPLELIINNRS